MGKIDLRTIILEQSLWHPRIPSLWGVI